MEGSVAGSVLVTNGYRSGSGRPKNIWIGMRIRFRNAAAESRYRPVSVKSLHIQIAHKSSCFVMPAITKMAYNNWFAYES